MSRFAKKKAATTPMWECVGYHLLLVAAIGFLLWQGWITLLAAIAFVPLLIRTAAGVKEENGKLNLKRIGIAEIRYTLFFAVLLVWGIKPSLTA